MKSVNCHLQQIYYCRSKTKVIVMFKAKSHSPFQESIHYFSDKTELCIPITQKSPYLFTGSLAK